MIFTRWGRAEAPISRFVAQSKTDLGIIDREIETLEAEEHEEESFKGQNRNLCVEALKSFKLLSNQLDFARSERILGPRNQKLPLTISGVTVSVLPQVILQGVLRNGEPVVGGIKFSFPKTHPLTEQSASYLSALVHWHCETHLSNLGRPHIKLCRAVDVPTATVFDAVTTYKRRRSHVEEACLEIARQWPQVPPPKNYIPPEKDDFED